MATRNIVPRATGEGSLGTETKKWGNIYAGNLHLSNPLPIANGGTGATTVAGARNALGLGNTTGALPIANGGTGASTAEQARTNLGLGNVATLNTVPIANGGTGASTAEQARTNLGLGNVATLNTVPIANGGTGATTAKQARENLEVEPIGTIFAFAGNNIPSGYLPCNGSAVSRTTYADLFAVIGTTYGAGDGSTTFNLPNLNNNSFLEGSGTVGTVKSAGLPNATGTLNWIHAGNKDSDERSGVFKGSTLLNTSIGISGSGGGAWNIKFNLANSSAIFGKADTVQPKSVTVKFCIKY